MKLPFVITVICVWVFANSFCHLESKNVLLHSDSRSDAADLITLAQFFCASIATGSVLSLLRSKSIKHVDMPAIGSPLSALKNSTVLLWIAAAAGCLGALCVNRSMAVSSVFLAHTIKASEPLTTAVMKKCLFGNVRLGPVRLGVLGTVVFGSALASLSGKHSTNGQLEGILFAVVSNCAMSFRNVALSSSGQMSSSRGSFAESVQFSFSVFWRGLVLLSLWILPPFFLRHWNSLIDVKSENLYSDAAQSAILSAIAFALYNCASLSILGQLGVLIHSVLNCAKRSLLLGLSAFIFATPLTHAQIIGCGMAVVGAAIFSALKKTSGINSSSSSDSGGTNNPIHAIRFGCLMLSCFIYWTC